MVHRRTLFIASVAALTLHARARADGDPVCPGPLQYDTDDEIVIQGTTTYKACALIGFCTPQAVCPVGLTSSLSTPEPLEPCGGHAYTDFLSLMDDASANGQCGTASANVLAAAFGEGGATSLSVFGNFAPTASFTVNAEDFDDPSCGNEILPGASADAAFDHTISIPFCVSGSNPVSFRMAGTLAQIGLGADTLTACGTWGVTSVAPSPIACLPEGPRALFLDGPGSAAYAEEGIIFPGNYTFTMRLASTGALARCAPVDGSVNESGRSLPILNVSFFVGCAGDVNSDGTVNSQDHTAVILAWGPCEPGCAEDLNADLTVDIQDLLIVINNWGACQ